MTDTVVEVDGEYQQTTKTPFALWLDALRSGEYQQGEGHLRAGDKFCCLGVACDLAVKNRVIPEPTKEPDWPSDLMFYGVEPEFRSAWSLPSEVAAWLGFDPAGECPDVTFGDQRRSVVDLNDHFQQPFGVIADALEAAYPHLLTNGEGK